jgi:3-phenylpropionate/trans-cinnamate dioxygenase ferredoxin subunit
VTETRHDVGPETDFAEDSITAVTVEDQDVIVIRQGGEVFALPDRCTHAKYPLHDGELLDGKIKCVHHGATFDLHSGRPTLPAVKKIRLFDAAIEDGRVVVTLQEA